MNNLPSKRLIIAQIFIVFVLPILLLYFHIIPRDYRMLLLVLSSLLIYGIIHRESWSHADLGLRLDNLKKSLPLYTLFTLLGVLLFFLIAEFFHIKHIESIKDILIKLVYFIPISFFQEFAYRAFLMPRLSSVFRSNFLIILLNAFLFTLLHIIYKDLVLIIPISFIGGLYFAWIYKKYPNLLLISISHAILNITAVLLGFFVI